MPYLLAVATSYLQNQRAIQHHVMVMQVRPRRQPQHVRQQGVHTHLQGLQGWGAGGGQHVGQQGVRAHNMDNNITNNIIP